MRLARLALAAALVVTVGCFSSNKGKIEGTNWLSQAATVKGEALPPGACQLQFDPSGQMSYRIGARTYKGIYALGMGPAITFTLEEEMEGRKIHPEKLVIDGEQLTLTSADGSSLTFQKVNLPAPPK